MGPVCQDYRLGKEYIRNFFPDGGKACYAYANPSLKKCFQDLSRSSDRVIRKELDGLLMVEGLVTRDGGGASAGS